MTLFYKHFTSTLTFVRRVTSSSVNSTTLRPRPKRCNREDNICSVYCKSEAEFRRGFSSLLYSFSTRCLPRERDWSNRVKNTYQLVFIYLLSIYCNSNESPRRVYKVSANLFFGNCFWSGIMARDFSVCFNGVFCGNMSRHRM